MDPVGDSASGEGDGLAKLLAAITGGDDESTPANADEKAEAPSGDD